MIRSIDGTDAGRDGRRVDSNDCDSGRADSEDGGRECWSRRRLLASGGSVVAVAMAGCTDGDDAVDPETLEPISLSGGLTCDVCGMVIEEHHGPAGQLFYADDEPDGRDGPARFDSLVELVTYRDERDRQGWTLQRAFATDYSAVEYELERRDGTTFVSSHVEADAFADATDLSYVVETDVHGAMGADYVPFSDPADAEEFAAEHGGDVRSWTDLS
ncbi:nitrous oxide reductase accessory protein NosL [Natrarchaeobius oligotrophus]|uniref:Nitrous oxide reductase accessory protein NosL n=1 Tax=Natrarchaeobius chitinivorans TaxID=1679083 RepID=A0A3N6MWW1_NATCH|nr:nitrous oxide reductase accessory protein NosL [Natrarchaeobius chitinivorans]RQH02491.1 nitrous oxide reductase accessory protein NosL [Natrarchaeobius chitinivorans]